MARVRLDTLLLDRGLVESREKARAAILAGEVFVNGQRAMKAGQPVDAAAELRLTTRQRFASRGGEKLEHALAAFRLDVEGAVALDGGASTGGFTDCLLQHGAARVYGVDVGYGQLDYRLRRDPRVVVMERINLRDLPPLPEVVDLATVDVAFISLTAVLPAVVRALRPGGLIVALVKPQFEAGRRDVGRGGVVRDPQVHAAVIGRVATWAVNAGLRVRDLAASPLLGPAGNREFFLLLQTPAAPADTSPES